MTRIVAGTHRGRRLQTPKGDATRPTSERVREAMFSSLSAWSGETADEALAGLTFLDLWAGSGAMGLEAASRGASQVVAVEKDKPTAALIAQNAKDLGLPVQVRAASVETLLAGPAPFACDAIWCDPPYAVETSHLQEMLPVLASWMAPKGILVVERDRRSEPLVPGDEFVECWTRRYGGTVLWYAMTGE